MVLGALAAAAALVVAGLAYRFVTSASVITSLAVLPFTHDGSDPNTEYLSSGMTESLINSLSQSASIRVLSRNTVAGFKGATSTLKWRGENCRSTACSRAA